MTASIEEKRTNHVIKSTPLNCAVRPSKIHSKFYWEKWALPFTRRCTLQPRGAQKQCYWKHREGMKNTHHSWKQQHTSRLVPLYLVFTNRAENSRMLKFIHTKRAGHRMRQAGFKPATAPTPLVWIASQKVPRKSILSSHTHTHQFNSYHSSGTFFK